MRKFFHPFQVNEDVATLSVCAWCVTIYLLQATKAEWLLIPGLWSHVYISRIKILYYVSWGSYFILLEMENSMENSDINFHISPLIYNYFSLKIWGLWSGQVFNSFFWLKQTLLCYCSYFCHTSSWFTFESA